MKLYYDKILNVERGSFFFNGVLSVTGGSGPEARNIFRFFCEKIYHPARLTLNPFMRIIL